MDSQGQRPAAGADRSTPRVLRYAVIACAQGWRVLTGRAQIGRFASRAEAMTVAVGLTKAAVEAGHETELLAQDEGGDPTLNPLFRTRALADDDTRGGAAR